MAAPSGMLNEPADAKKALKRAFPRASSLACLVSKRASEFRNSHGPISRTRPLLSPLQLQLRAQGHLQGHVFYGKGAVVEPEAFLVRHAQPLQPAKQVQRHPLSAAQDNEQVLDGGELRKGSEHARSGDQHHVLVTSRWVNCPARCGVARCRCRHYTMPRAMSVPAVVARSVGVADLMVGWG